jgi:MoxR-like ATPase
LARPHPAAFLVATAAGPEQAVRFHGQKARMDTEQAPQDDTLEMWRDRVAAFEAAIGRAVIGQSRVIRLLTIAILARGHALLEGDVGVGKTTLLRSVARALGGPYERVEGTIDLMPADLIYHASLSEDGRPRLDPGPVLRHGPALAIFFFNEINRARPQVHALLLRLMAERSVTAFNREVALPHLLVFADRNQLEREETFELPAAARDRFFMEIAVHAPSDPEICRQLIVDTRFHDVDTLIEEVPPGILDYRALTGVGARIQRHIHTSPHLEAYLVALWQALRDPAGAGITIDGVDMTRLVQGGASPRGISALARAARVHAWLAGRNMVVPEDIRAIFPETMSHRIFIDPLYENRAAALVAELRRQLFARVPVP